MLTSSERIIIMNTILARGVVLTATVSTLAVLGIVIVKGVSDLPKAGVIQLD